MTERMNPVELGPERKEKMKPVKRRREREERINSAQPGPGMGGRIRGLFLEEEMKRRLQDLGMIEGVYIECVGKSPLGDPAAFLVKGTVVALRREEYERIELETDDSSPFMRHRLLRAVETKEEVLREEKKEEKKEASGETKRKKRRRR